MGQNLTNTRNNHECKAQAAKHSEYTLNISEFWNANISNKFSRLIAERHTNNKVCFSQWSFSVPLPPKHSQCFVRRPGHFFLMRTDFSHSSNLSFSNLKKMWQHVPTPFSSRSEVGMKTEEIVEKPVNTAQASHKQEQNYCFIVLGSPHKSQSYWTCSLIALPWLRQKDSDLSTAALRTVQLDRPHKVTQAFDLSCPRKLSWRNSTKHDTAI